MHWHDEIIKRDSTPLSEIFKAKEMTDHNRYKAMLKDLDLTPKDVAPIAGVTLGSYYVAIRRDAPGLPHWAATMLWLYEKCGKQIAKKFIDDLDIK